MALPDGPFGAANGTLAAGYDPGIASIFARRSLRMALQPIRPVRKARPPLPVCHARPIRPARQACPLQPVGPTRQGVRPPPKSVAANGQTYGLTRPEAFDAPP